MLGHGLSRSETAGNGSGAAFGDGEHGVQDSLSGHQRNGSGIAPPGGAGNPDGPFLAQGQILFGTVGKLQRHDGIQNSVLTVGSHPGYRTRHIGRNHGFVYDGSRFLSFRDDGSAGNLISRRHRQMNLPFFLSVQGIYADAPADVFSGMMGDFPQGALDTVKNVIEDSGAQGHGNGVSGAGYLRARLQAGGFLKYLNRGSVFRQGDHLAHQMLGAHMNHLRHAEAGFSFQINHGTVDPVDNSSIIHLPYLR